MTKSDLVKTGIRIPQWVCEIVKERAEDEGIPIATILRSLVLKALKEERGDVQ